LPPDADDKSFVSAYAVLVVSDHGI